MDNGGLYTFEEFKNTFHFDDYIVEIGCVDEVDREYRRSECKTAFVAFKFPNSKSSIDDLMDDILAELAVQELPFELESKEGRVTIYDLPIEDNVQLHFFDDTYVKKLIVSSRNRKQDLRYNMVNTFFVIDTALNNVLRENGFYSNELRDYMIPFDYKPGSS
jgi:hypothetical protein